MHVNACNKTIPLNDTLKIYLYFNNSSISLGFSSSINVNHFEQFILLKSFFFHYYTNIIL